MNEALILILEEGLYLALWLALPALAGHLVGTLVGDGVRRAAGSTDSSLANFPRQVVVIGAVILALPWTGGQLLEFMQSLLHLVGTVSVN